MSDAPGRPPFTAADQDHMPTITCVNEATVDLQVDWQQLIAALDAYANTIFAPVWGTPARIVDAGASRTVPPGSWGLVFMDDPDRQGFLGYHDLTADGLPLAKIFVRTILKDGEKVSVAASHELTEMLVDPGIQMGARGPDGVTWYAYETADAVEHDEFPVNGLAMSNFVYPAWFEGFRRPGSTKFDHLQNTSAPFELRPRGYIDVFRNGAWEQEFGSDHARTRFNPTAHPRAGMRRRIMRHRSDHPRAKHSPP